MFWLLTPNLSNFLHVLSKNGQPPILGLDGSCLISSKNKLWQFASWAIVGCDAGVEICGHVEGADQSPAAAERTAVLQALLAPNKAHVPVRLLAGNQPIVQRGLEPNSWHGDVPGFWLRTLLPLWLGGLRSCGSLKVPNWTPAVQWGLTVADSLRRPSLLRACQLSMTGAIS